MRRLPGDPSVFRWLLFAVGFRLPAENREWVWHELTDAGWRTRTIVRLMVLLGPICVALAFLPGPEWLGVAVNEPYLRDTVNVPFYSPAAMQHYPTVRLRMDFRDPNTVGTFVYHCHLLDHEDGGMMGLIRVEPAATAP